MKYGKVQGVDKPVSRLVLGTMIINANEQPRSSELLDAAFELGCTTFDTAHVYGGGNSERGLGVWMRERGNREKVVILSKGAIPNGDRNRVTPFDITSDLHDSLARLKSSYIDIYLLHRDDPSVPVGPIVEVLNEHLRAGRIRAFGGSNWTHERLQAANDYAVGHGLVPFTASSPNYGLAEQVEDPWGPGCTTLSGPTMAAARAWYRAQNMPVFAYSSLGRGFFSGRVSRANFEMTKAQLDGACVKAYCHEVNFRRLDRVEQLAKERGLTVPQIAMAWILKQPLHVFAIVGAATREEFRAHVDVLQASLSNEESAWLNLESEQRNGNR